jgi:23S rRNA (adenine1618-N6)-methyltransferase
MHPRNVHQDRYCFPELIKANPDLGKYVIANKKGEDSINYDDPAAVRALNSAILAHHYGIKHWEITQNFLCPPIPGRANYLHHLADLFESAKGLRGLDIGVGANCIYPLIGQAAYQWTFVGSDINQEALRSAEAIIRSNQLQGKIELRHQPSPGKIFEGIIKENEHFDFTLCNPPFHSSAEEARSGTERKWKNLKRGHKGKLNFGGQSTELWCEGGEKAFIAQMIKESHVRPKAVTWYTTLVSKEANLPYLKKMLQLVHCPDVRVIDMSHGQKKSRILAWRWT